MFFVFHSFLQHPKADCPRYAYVQIHPDGGLGHKMSNWLQSLALCVILSLTLLHPAFPESLPNNNHFDTTLSRIEEFFGLSAVNITHYDAVASSISFNRVPFPIPPATVPQFASLIPNLQHQVNSVPTCNTVFQFDEYWPNHFRDKPFYTEPPVDVARLFLTHSFLNAHSATQWLLRTGESPRFNSSHANIAVHIRVGDFVSFQPQVFKNVLETISSMMKDMCVAFVFHVFLQRSPESESFVREFDHIQPMHVHMIGPLETFLHFTFADILVTGGSSMSSLAALISPIPFVFALPEPRGGFGMISDDHVIINDAGYLSNSGKDRFRAFLVQRANACYGTGKCAGKITT